MTDDGPASASGRAGGRGELLPVRMGRVSRAHGLAGELEVRLDWAQSTALLEVPEVVLEDAAGVRRSHAVRAARRTPKGVLLLLDGIADRDAAEGLVGQVVGVARAALPPLAPGEYYLCDLVGMEVCHGDQSLGTVAEIQVYPSVDAMVISTRAGSWMEQPIVDEWIAEVDLERRRVVLASLDGLIEVPDAARPAGSGS